MALWIRDGFEGYASTTDMYSAPAGYGIWTGTIGTNNWGLTTNTGQTRFHQGAALISGAFGGSALYYTNSTNQQTVFGGLAFNITSGGIALGWQDTTSFFQVFINFNSDGSISITNSHGTLGSFPGAFVPGQWNQCQVKTFIDSVNGSVQIRMNGATSATFAVSGVNTQVSANAYANGVFLNQNGGSLGGFFDDFAAWDNTGVTAPWNDWIGDFRISQLVPVTDNSVQWTKNHPVGDSTNFGFPSNAAGPNAFTANRLFVWPFTPVRGGQLSSFTVNMNSGYTGNMRLALYDSNGNGGGLLGNGLLPGALIASTNQVTNPVGGDNTFTWPATAPSVATNRLYFIGMLTDATATTNLQSGAVGDRDYAFTYGAFPAVFDNSLAILNSGAFPPTIHATITFTNAACVDEQTADDSTTYVSDATPGDTDLYGITTLPPNAYTILGVDLVTRLEKSDAGGRTVSALLKSGGTTVTETGVAPNTSYNWYKYRHDTDPNTSATWTVANLQASLIGQTVVS